MKPGQPSELSLGELIQHLDGLVYRCRNDAQWTMEYVSEGCLALTGYPAHGLLFNDEISYQELIEPEDRETVRRLVDKALACKQSFEIEYRIRRADGEPRWVWERGYGVFDNEGNIVAIDGFVQDITRMKQSDIARAEAERRFQDIFDNAHEGIFQSTRDGRYLRVNRALARIYGYESPEALIEGLGDIGNQLYVDVGRRDEFVCRLEKDQRLVDFESRVYRRDGRVIWISENARRVCDAEGQLLYFEGTVEDITERKEYGTRIEYQARHDALTGLPNRSMLLERLQHAIERGEREGSGLSLLFVDLDHFKDVNDTLGHSTGDRLLQWVGRRLSECVRTGDMVARLGGDEFVLLLEGSSDDDLSATTSRILAAVALPCVLGGKEVSVTCSLGVSVYPRDGEDAETLLKHADRAMYGAKHEGRNTFQRFRPDLSHGASDRLELAARLRRALDRDEFELHYQPQVELSTGTVTGMEALLRWRCADGSLIMPDRFITLAEESGMIEPLGDWVLNEACRFARDWGHPPVSVNVSPRQFRRGDFVASVQAALARSGLPPERLELEITENCIAEDGEHFIHSLHALERLGVGLALDDFGTGYSSLAYLKKIPIRRLKIDRSFVGKLEYDSANRAILRAVVLLGHELRLRVLAEGVETSAERDFLLNIGCDEAQGYLFGRPRPAQHWAESHGLPSHSG